MNGMKRQVARSSKKRAWPDAVRQALAGEGGFVLVSALLAVAVLLVLTLSVSSLASGESRAAPFWRDRSEAVYVAESGLEHSLWKLQYDGDSEALQEHQGVFPTDPPTFTSTSEPESMVTVAGEEVLVTMPPGSFYEVWVKIDAVDTAKAAVTVRGRVNSESYLLKTTVHQTDIPFEDGEGTGIGYRDEDTVVYPPPDTDDYEDMIVAGKEKMEIPAGTYVIHDMKATGTGQLFFLGDAVVWVLGSGSAEGEGKINPLGGPGISVDERVTLVIYVVSGVETFAISGSAKVNAFIYAPKIKCTGNPDIFGMLVADEIKIKGSVTYDPQGEDIGFPVSAITEWEVISWGE